MNSACLLPYCPLPVNNGARAVFSKHIKLLNSLGKCRILSNRSRPVGFGWKPEHIRSLIDKGFTVTLDRGITFSKLSQIYGVTYAVFFKVLHAEKAFGHSNPYHRYAFNPNWVYEQSRGVDLCEIHYSYWAQIPTACPKVVIVHDLWSDIMWEGARKETLELKKADLVVTVSQTDHDKLTARGLKNVHWSPPVVEKQECSDSSEVMIVGSNNKFNQEGLRWLTKALACQSSLQINLYGSLAEKMKNYPSFALFPEYKMAIDPYRDNGIVLITTSQGTGIQIKAIEALACGRAIVARKGAMRGLPDVERGWLEYDDPFEMVDTVQRLRHDKNKRHELMNRASKYYDTYLSSDHIMMSLSERYADIC